MRNSPYDGGAQAHGEYARRDRRQRALSVARTGNHRTPQPCPRPTAIQATRSRSAVSAELISRFCRGTVPVTATPRPSCPTRPISTRLKAIGVTHLLTVSAVGSLNENLPPLTVVLPDQIIDRTTLRPTDLFRRRRGRPRRPGRSLLRRVSRARPKRSRDDWRSNCERWDVCLH